MQQKQQSTQQHTQQHTQNLPSQALIQEDKMKIKNVLKTTGEKEKELREMLQKKKQDLLLSLEERDKMLSRIDGNSIIADSLPDGSGSKIINNLGKNDVNSSMKNGREREGEGGDEENDMTYENVTKKGNDSYQRLDQVCDDDDGEEEEVEEEEEDDHSLNVSHTSDTATPILNMANYIPANTSSPLLSSHSPSIFNSDSSLHSTSNSGLTGNNTTSLPLSLPLEAANTSASLGHVPYGNRNSDSTPYSSFSSSSSSSSSFSSSSSSSAATSSFSSSSSSKGTCESMCPYEERKQRIEESDVHKLEYPPSA